MNRQEYIELVNDWKSFIKDINLNNNKNIINESFRSSSVDDSIENIQGLIEWGDRVESIINEHIDIIILESYHLNEGVFSAFRKAKDNVKQNKTKENVAEYTLASRAVASLVRGVQVLSIIAALAPKLGVENFSTPNIVNMDEQVFVVAGDEGPVTPTEEDVKIAEKVANNKKIKVPKLNRKQTRRIVDQAVEAAVKANPNSDLDKDRTIEMLEEELSSMQLSSNIDPNEPYEDATRDIEDITDYSRANSMINKLSNACEFKGMISQKTKIIEDFHIVKLFPEKAKKVKEKLLDLNTDQIKKLITAAKLYTIRELSKKNPDLFEKGNIIKVTSHQHYGFNIGEKPNFENSGQIKGETEALILYSIYQSFADPSSIEESNNIDSLFRNFSNSLDNKNIKDNNRLVTQAKRDFKYFIISNLSPDNSNNIEESLNDNPEFNLNIMRLTQSGSSSSLNHSIADQRQNK